MTWILENNLAMSDEMKHTFFKSRKLRYLSQRNEKENRFPKRHFQNEMFVMTLFIKLEMSINKGIKTLTCP